MLLVLKGTVQLLLLYYSILILSVPVKDEFCLYLQAVLYFQLRAVRDTSDDPFRSMVLVEDEAVYETAS